MYLVKPGDRNIMRLVKMLGLPEKTIWFKMNLGIDSPVRIECEYFPEEKAIREMLQDPEVKVGQREKDESGEDG